MSEVVGYQLQDGVAVINLDNGKVNAVSHEVIDGLNKALDQAEADKAVVVLTGKPGILSGGYDLKIMQTSMDAAIGLVTAGSTLARRMLAHPFPIIVACPGHAVAKGAFLLLSADYRIGAAGAFQIGLNEVAIGMTMHHVGIELARGRLTTPAFHRSVINAEMFGPEAAVNAGFLDQVVAPEALMDTAMATAKAMKKLNMRAHKQTKLKSRAEFLATLDKSIALDQDSKLQ